MSQRTEPAATVLTCVSCSGGVIDENGAYTLCALCELLAADMPAAA